VALLAGLASLFFHDLADFSLETLGVALPAAVALGLLSRRLSSVSVPGWAYHLVGVVAGLGVVAASLAYERTVVPAQLAVVPSAAATDPRPAAARALRYAPADYVIPSNVGASLEGRGQCRDAMPWLTSATALNPSAPEPHLLLARCLRAGGRAELARQETLLAIALGDPRGYDEAIQSQPVLADLLRSVPATPDHLLALAERLARPRPADAATVLRSVLDEYLDDRALLPLARAELALKQPAVALELARRAQAVRAPAREAWYLAYVARVEQGDVEGGIEELKAGVARFPGSSQLLGPLVERALSFQRYGEARRLTEEIGPSSAGEAAWKYLLLARVYAAQGRFAEAMQEDRAAAAAMPEWPAPLLQLANHAINANHYADAVAALEQACPMPGHDAGACARLLTRARELEAADEAAARQRSLDRLVEPR
jgi:tetratricopeptide (TPR) repeat protein